MAGTTVNEDNVVYKTLLSTLQRAGYDLDLPLVLREGAGKEKLQAIRDILQRIDGNDGRARELYANFREELTEAYGDLTVRSFPGAADLIGRLRRNGVTVALNTGYDRATAERLLRKMQWKKGEQYDLLATADDVAAGRPAPDMIQLLMELSGIRVPTFVAKAGDSAVDIEEGRRAGCGLTVGVTTGAQSRAQLMAAGADLVVDDLAVLVM